MPNIIGLNYHDQPIGSIQPFGGTVVPANWLLCDGTAYAQVTYPALYAAITGNFGTAGSNFNVPDLRGRFLRGTDNMGTGAAGRDPDTGTRTAMNTGGSAANAVGSVQSHAMQAHYHQTPFDKSNANGSFGQAAIATDSGLGLTISYAGNLNIPPGPVTTTGNNSGNQGNDTRPINAYVNYIIKAL